MTVRLLIIAACWLGLSASAQAEVCHIRALLADEKSQVTVGGELDWSDGSRDVGSSSQPVEVKRVGSEVKVVFGDRGVQAKRLSATPRSGYARYGGKNYRGRFELFISGNGNLLLLNVLPLDDYLLGVVPSEMPHSWPMPALQAQSVAARTYAISRIVDRQSHPYDVVTTVMDQVYRGLDGEQERTSEAVRSTAGQIVTFNGKPIVAYYCSDAGGCTKCGTEPYLQSVPIESPDSPHNQWHIPLKRDALAALVSRAGGKIGTLAEVEAQIDGASGHLIKLICIGDKGRHTFTGAKLRQAVGLKTMKSTRAWIEIVGQGVGKPEVIARPRVSTPSGRGLDVIAVQLEPQAVEVGSLPASGFAAGRATQAISLPAYSRPWVAFAGGVAGLKLRSVFISNGRTTVPAKGDMLALGIAAAEVAMSMPVSAAPSSSAVVAKAKPSRADAPANALRSIDAANDAPPELISGKVGPEGIVIHGRGYGHGMGLSQWGAKTLAERGQSYDQILSYFYSGVRLSEIDGRLRVSALQPAAGTQKPAQQKRPQAESDDEGAVPVFYTPFAPGRK